MPALRTLQTTDDQFFDPGTGGGASWLQEHLQGGYHRRWSTGLTDGESPDAAIADTSLTRWENYYIQVRASRSHCAVAILPISC